MSLESLHEWSEVLLGCKLDTYEGWAEVLVGLTDVLDVNKVVCRADNIAASRLQSYEETEARTYYVQ